MKLYIGIFLISQKIEREKKLKLFFFSYINLLLTTILNNGAHHCPYQ